MFYLRAGCSGSESTQLAMSDTAFTPLKQPNSCARAITK
jgi:hypothetical protein